MKIPETSASVGAYYGNEENGQWQPNGVIIDSGVGGGVVGSGDAGHHRPPVYPVHIPRAHMPGYVMAGAYYPPGAYPAVPAQPQPDDFADYMWMENEEEFDKQVMQQLEEEALMEQCIEAMLEDEQRERHNRPTANGHNHHYPTGRGRQKADDKRERCRPDNGHYHQYPTTSNGASSLSLEETVSRSTLNPLAAEFVPTRPIPPATDERQDPPEVTAAPVHKTEETTTVHAPSEIHIEEEQDNTEEPVPPQKDPPEVSAADTIDKNQDKRPKEKRDSKPKIEVKKAVKTELKPKVKPQTVKSETKVAPKKKDVFKSVKSETKMDEKIEEVNDLKPQPAPVEEIQAPSGFKPINYAAAAKANKPKKPSATTEKPQQPKIEKPKLSEKIDKKDSIKQPKSEKINTQRKNSAK